MDQRIQNKFTFRGQMCSLWAPHGICTMRLHPTASITGDCRRRLYAWVCSYSLFMIFPRTAFFPSHRWWESWSPKRLADFPPYKFINYESQDSWENSNPSLRSQFSQLFPFLDYQHTEGVFTLIPLSRSQFKILLESRDHDLIQTLRADMTTAKSPQSTTLS